MEYTNLLRLFYKNIIIGYKTWTQNSPYLTVLTYLRTIILPFVLYGCETWSLTLREEHRLRVFGNRVLRRIFGIKRDGVTSEWRKLHNEELKDQ